MDSTKTNRRLAGPLSRNRFRWLLIAAAMLPFCWSLLQRVTGSTPAMVQAAPERPGLVFHQFLVDRGRVPAISTVGAQFWFTNRGSTPVRILDMQPSCGCLQPRLTKRDIPPGESGKIILPVQTPNQSPGPHEYRVRVRYTDPHPNETTLTFRVTLPEKQVMVEPRSLIFYQFGTGSTTRKIAVIDAPNSGLKLTAASCNLEFVSVEIRESKIDSNGQPRHYVSVTVPGVMPEGRHRAIITITTDHPKYRVLRVPMIVIKSRRLPTRKARSAPAPESTRR